MKPKKRASKASAFEMYCYATSYWKGAALLSMPINIVPYVIPWHVLEVLSLEVYLKCLRRIRGKAPLAMHPINELFEDLSKDDQRRIRKHFKAIFTRNGTMARHMKLQSVIDRASDMFTVARYGYEHASWPRDANNHVGNVGFSQAIMAIRAVIAEKHPDWPEKCRHSMGTDILKGDQYLHVIDAGYFADGCG